MPTVDILLRDMLIAFEGGDEKDFEAQKSVQFDCKEFENDTLTSDNWKTIGEKFRKAEAIAFHDCGLKKIEALPTGDSDKALLKKLEILDISGNDIESLEFASSLPHLISLHVRECPGIKSISCLKPLAKHEKLKVLEFSDENLLGEKTEEDFRKKVFETIPELVVLNGCDAEGMEVPEEEDDEEEDYEEMLGNLEGLTDEQIQALMEGEGDDSDDDDDEDGEEDADEDADEPAAKKQKKE